MRRLLIPIALVLGGTVLAGCNAYRLETPSGFAQVSEDDYGAHYKGRDNVGLRINAFDNVEGGTLAFWSEDLVRKLGTRGYRLVKQSPVKAKNGLPGTRFDFTYDPPGEDATERGYAVVLFVSDKRKVVIQLAGKPEATATYDDDLDRIASAIRVRGCRAWTDICDGPQPGALSTPPPANDDEDADGPDPAVAPGDTELADDGAPSGG